MIHHRGNTGTEGGSYNEISAYLFKIGQFFHRESSENLPSDKIIARRDAEDFNTVIKE